MNTKQVTVLVLSILVPFILLILIFFVYFGTLKPQNLIPDQCAITSGFTCRDHFLNENEISLLIISNMGEEISVNNFSITKTGSEDVCYSNNSYDAIPDGGQFSLNCTNLPELWTLRNGGKAKLGFKYYWSKKDSYLPHTVTGTVTSTIGINDREYMYQRQTAETLSTIAIILGLVIIAGLYVFWVVKLIKKMD